MAAAVDGRKATGQVPAATRNTEAAGPHTKVLGIAVRDRSQSKWSRTGHRVAQSRATGHTAALTTCAMAPGDHGENVDRVTATAPAHIVAAPTAKAMQLPITTKRGQACGNSLPPF